MDGRPTEGAPFIPPQETLLPGGASAAGFLEEGQSLDKVVQRDHEALRTLGYTKEEIIDLLSICDLEIPNAPVRTEGQSFEDYDRAISEWNWQIREGSKFVAPNGKEYKVKIEQYRGHQECPWEDVDYIPGSNKNLVFDAEVGGERYAYLIPGGIRHLIQAHDFFEGSRMYRVAPEDVVELFGVERIPGSIEKARTLPI